VRPRAAGRWSNPQASPQGKAVQPNPPEREGHGVVGGVEMGIFVSNAFSLSMLGALPPAGLTVKVRPLTLEEVKEVLSSSSFTSAVGHESTAAVLTTLLGLPVEARRVAITLSPGDRVIVFQLAVRLAEGQILTAEEVASLYQEGKATFVLVEVQE